jgi:hypothetical protein
MATASVYLERPASRLRWSAIFGGTIVALGVWVLLYAFGLAAGLSSIDPGEAGSVRGAGVGTGIWALVAPLIALFVGGMVAARTAGAIDRMTGAIHGAVIWGLATLVGVAFIGSVLGALLGGAFSLGKSAAQAGGAAVSGVVASAGSQGDMGDMAKTLGIDSSELLGPVNERLQQQGMPPVTADQLQASLRDAVGTSVSQGSFDRETFVGALARNTALSPEEADSLADRVQSGFDARVAAMRGKAQDIKEQATTGALKAADKTGKAFWGVFGALLLGLVSAVLGAITGAGRRGQVVTVEEEPKRKEVYP